MSFILVTVVVLVTLLLALALACEYLPRRLGIVLEHMLGMVNSPPGLVFAFISIATFIDWVW